MSCSAAAFCSALGTNDFRARSGARGAKGYFKYYIAYFWFTCLISSANGSAL